MHVKIGHQKKYALPSTKTKRRFCLSLCDQDKWCILKELAKWMLCGGWFSKEWALIIYLSLTLIHWDKGQQSASLHFSPLTHGTTFWELNKNYNILKQSQMIYCSICFLLTKWHLPLSAKHFTYWYIPNSISYWSKYIYCTVWNISILVRSDVSFCMLALWHMAILYQY